MISFDICVYCYVVFCVVFKVCVIFSILFVFEGREGLSRVDGVVVYEVYGCFGGGIDLICCCGVFCFFFSLCEIF